MSPLTERRAKQLLSLCAESGKGKIAPGMKKAITCAKEELQKRLERDEEYAEDVKKLEEMQTKPFFIRYGDYYAAALAQIRRTAKSLPKTATGNVTASETSATPPVGPDAPSVTVALSPDTVLLGSNHPSLDPGTVLLGPDAADDKTLTILVEDEDSARAAFRKWSWARNDVILKEEEKDMNKWARRHTTGDPLNEVKLSISAYVNRNSIPHANLQTLAAEAIFTSWQRDGKTISSGWQRPQLRVTNMYQLPGRAFSTWLISISRFSFGMRTCRSWVAMWSLGRSKRSLERRLHPSSHQKTRRLRRSRRRGPSRRTRCRRQRENPRMLRSRTETSRTSLRLSRRLVGRSKMWKHSTNLLASRRARFPLESYS